jgi:hypothetical protein
MIKLRITFSERKIQYSYVDNILRINYEFRLFFNFFQLLNSLLNLNSQ